MTHPLTIKSTRRQLLAEVARLREICTWQTQRLKANDLEITKLRESLGLSNPGDNLLETLTTLRARYKADVRWYCGTYQRLELGRGWVDIPRGEV